MTMRLFAEERKTGAITLLFSAPVSLTEIVLGKFLGVLGFIAVVIVLMALMPLSLAWSTNMDWGRVAAGLLGLFLLMMSFGAVGLFVSSCTREPRSEEHTSELQSLMRISYAVFCLKKKKKNTTQVSTLLQIQHSQY